MPAGGVGGRGISVLICGYNSAARLPATLAALGRLQAPTGGYGVEVLVIDNASTDDTALVAGQVLAGLAGGGRDWHLAYQVLTEPQPGKSYALALGLAQARYEYVCIVDDDNWLAPDYLNRAWAVLEANPTIGALGGVGEPVCEVAPPAWFPEFAIDYAAAPQALKSGDVTQSNRYLYGAGMVLRKQAWMEVSEQDFSSLLTEVRGNKPSGEDNEMCYALTLGGYRIWYDEGLRFRHLIPAQRLTWQYLRNTYRVNAVAHVELRPWTYYLELGAARPARAPALGWLRSGVYILRYMLPVLGRALRHGELNQEGSADSLRVLYYWQSFKGYLLRQLHGDQGFELAARYVNGLRSRQPARSTALNEQAI